MSKNRRTLAFVIPWYSDSIGGGAETACRSLARLLQNSGLDVEILTTCVKDFRSDWSSNFYREGRTIEGLLPVRRFPVRARNTEAFDAVNAKLITGYPITASEESTFLNEMIHSPALYTFIEQNRDRYVFAFIPYMFGTTFSGYLGAPEQSILIPCLHDEPYAGLRVFKDLFTSAAGSIFLSEPERDLAIRMYGPDTRVMGVLGLPIEVDCVANPARFRQQYGIDKFAVYIGRADRGKGADVLLEYFVNYLRDTGDDMRLVFLGAADLHIPDSLASRIYALGFVSEQDKRDCLAAARVLCVPSVMESYSIVLMESWVAGTPAIVNESCAVTTDFCRRSNGGLWYRDYDDFREALNWMNEHPDAAAQLGRNGRIYVREHFSPEVVAHRYLKVLLPLLDMRADGAIGLLDQ